MTLATAKNIVRRILNFGPFGLYIFGQSSQIKLPRKILGKKYISIGKRTFIFSNSWLQAIDNYQGIAYQPELSIGDDVYIGSNSCIVAMNKVIISSECVLSEHVYIADNAHGIDPRMGLIMKQNLVCKGPVLIGKGCFIGYRAVIVSGVTLGEHCVVGANSVVTRSFPPHSMIAGSPAKLIKRFDFSSGSWTPITNSVENI